MDDQNNNDQPLSGSEPQQPAQPASPETPPQTPMPTQPQPAAPVPPPAPGAKPVSTYGQPAAPYGQPQVPGQQPAGYYQPAAPQTSGKAIGALVCGILAILFSALPLIGIVLGVVAIVLASKAVKESGKDGKTTGGKVCGILGIVFSVLAFILYLVLGLGIAAFIASDPDLVEYSNTSTTMPSSPSVPSSEGEADIEAAAAAELDKLKNKDAAVVQKLATELDEGLADSAGYSLSDLGVDPKAFAEWMLVDLDYQLDGAFDNGDGTATAYADVTLRDSLAFATTFMQDAQAAIDAGEMDGMDEAAAKAKLGELYAAAMEKSTGMTTDYVSFDLVKTGDTWQVEEGSLSDELDYLFGLY